MSYFAHHECRINIDFGLTTDGHMEVCTTVESPEAEVDGELPHRIQVEGALMMARDSLDAIYSEEG